MSGLRIPQTDEKRQRRYQEMLHRVNNSTLPSSNYNRSMFDSKFGSTLNTTEQTQQSDATLSTQQFYHLGSNPNFNQTSVDGPSRAPSVATLSTYTSSDATNFKLPQTTRSYSAYYQLQSRFDIVVERFREIENKAHLKLALRLIEETFHTLRPKCSQLSVHRDPSSLLDFIYHSVKDKYYSGRIPKSISETTSVISHYTSNKDQEMPMKELQIPPAEIQQMQSQPQIPPPHQIPGSQRILSTEDISCIRNPTVSLNDFRHCVEVRSTSSISHPKTAQKKMGSAVTQESKSNTTKNSHTTLPSSGTVTHETVLEVLREIEDNDTSLFNDTIIAQKRDEEATQQTVVATKRGKKKKSNEHVMLKEALRHNVTATQNNQNSSELMNGTCSKTRTGRIIKKPMQYWKGFEDSPTPVHNDSNSIVHKNPEKGSKISKDNLNESMTLRNNKIVYSSSSASGKKGTPLTLISENENLPKSNRSKQEKSKTLIKDGKENVIETKKSTKKGNNSIIMKKTNSSESSEKEIKKKKSEHSKQAGKKTSEKNETKQKPLKKKDTEQKPIKKEGRKRKNKDLDGTLPKKQKIDEIQLPELENGKFSDYEDDLFFGNDFKKKTNTIQALSPTSGLLSAKKAAGSPLGKETPPCKSLGQLINSSGYSAASSAAKEHFPNKTPPVVKRVAKMVEKGVNNNNNHQAKNDKKVNKQKGKQFSYTTTTPLAATTLTSLLENAIDSENESDLSEDDEDLL